MGRMNTRPVVQTQVYAQDTEPSDTRDGVLWVDTSVSPRVTKVYSADTASWEEVAPGNVTISDNPPTGVQDGHLWIETAAVPPEPKVYEADTDSWERAHLLDAARAHRTGAQTISTSTVTQVQFNTTAFNDGNFDTSNYHYSVPESGKYHVICKAAWDSDTGWSTGDRIDIRIAVNGSVNMFSRGPKVGTAYHDPEATAYVDVATGDTIEMEVWQNSGAGKDIRGGSADTIMEVARVV